MFNSGREAAKMFEGDKNNDMAKNKDSSMNKLNELLCAFLFFII